MLIFLRVSTITLSTGCRTTPPLKLFASSQVTMDEEYDVIVLGTGLKVKFIYTNIASHDNKDLMTSILNKFHF